MPYELPAVVDPRIEARWDGVTWDSLTADTLLPPAIEIEHGRDLARAFGRPQTPVTQIVLMNEERRYGSQYQGSDIYGMVRPGRDFAIRAAAGTAWLMNDPGVLMSDPQAFMNGLTEPLLFTGTTDVHRETYGFGRNHVEVPALGRMRRMLRYEVSVGLQQNITTGLAMQLVFMAALYGVDEFTIDPDVIANGRILSWWWVDKRPAWEVALELWATEGPPAYLGEDREGRIVFEGRNYRTLNARSNTAQATFDNDDLVYADLPIEAGHDRIINDGRISVEVRAAEATQQVWQAEGPIVLTANDSWSYEIRTDQPFTNLQPPTVTTDYVLGAGSLTTVSLVATGAFTAALTLVAGAGGATVNPSGANTGIQIRAAPVTVASKVDVVPTVDVSVSRDIYGVQSLGGLSIWPGLQAAEAQSLIDSYVLYYQQSRPRLTMTLDSTSGPKLMQILQRQISDRVWIRDIRSGVDRHAFIERITYRFEPGRWMMAVFDCEAAIDTSWGIWDVDTWDGTLVWGS